MFKKAVLFAMTALIALTSLGCGGGDRQSMEAEEEGQISPRRERYEDPAPDEQAPQE